MAVDPKKNVRWGALIALFVGTAVIAPIAVYRSFSPTPEASTSQARPAQTSQSISESLASLLGMRSPGEREKGLLAATKLKSIPHYASVVPRERALGKVIRPEAFAKPPPGSSEIPEAFPSAAPAIGPDNSALAAVPNGGGLAPGLGTPAGTTIFGGPGIPGIPQPPVTPIPPGIPAVPEPATWLMMLLGFAAVGCANRTAASSKSSVVKGA